MLYLQEQTLRKVIAGVTSINEMVRVLSKPAGAKQKQVKKNNPAIRRRFMATPLTILHVAGCYVIKLTNMRSYSSRVSKGTTSDQSAGAVVWNFIALFQFVRRYIAVARGLL